MANYALDTPQPVEAGFTVSDLWKVLYRRRMVGLAILGGFLILALAYSLVATKKYTSSGLIQVQREGSTAIDVTDFGGAKAIGDPLAATINQETQASILQSDTLALKVIKDLNLEKTPDFEAHWNPIGAFFSLFSSDPPDPAGATLDNSPKRRTVALKKFSKNLTVKVVSGTRLVQVDYTNPDPKIASDVVNHLIKGLTDFAYDTKTATSSEAAGFLEAQLGDLRKKSEEDQAKLAAAQKNADLFSFGTDKDGHEQIYSDVLDKLQQSTAALATASQNRISKEAVYKAVRSGNAELISELSGTSNAAGGGTPVANALTLIQSLRLRQSTLKEEIANSELKYGSAYPKLVELRASLENVTASLNDEVARVAARAKNDYDVSVQTESQIRAQNEANHRAADSLKDKAVDYTILREEANQSRTLYEDLLKKLKEVDVTQGLHGTDLTVIDPGRVPAKPTKPNTLLNLGIGLALGLLFGIGGMLVAEGADGRVQSTGQIEAMGIPMIGILPQYGTGHVALSGVRDLRTLNAPKSAYSEAVRSVRASLVAPGAVGTHRVIVVTSPAPGEGKSLTARNLAVSLAQQGKRVVLVDADFRSITGGSGADFSAKEGLATVLSGLQAAPALMQVANLPSLFLLPSGTPPKNPAELLSSPRMKNLVDELRQQFDVVLIDTPPVLPVVDALLLSEMADSIVLVARHGETDQESLGRAYQLLASRSKPDSIAVLLNGVEMKSDIYRSYFGKTTAHYYQEDANEVA